MTLLDFFGKVMATGGFFTGVSFFLLLIFGQAIVEAGDKNETNKKISSQVLGGLCFALIGGLALITVGSLGYIWAR